MRTKIIPQFPQSDQQLEISDEPELKYIPFDEAPKCYRFASAVLMFGAALRKSKFVKDVSWNDMLKIATDSADPLNYSQMEFLTMIQHAKSIYGKKRKKG